MKIKKSFIILFITIFLLFVFYIFNDKITLTFKGCFYNNSTTIATGNTITNKKYKVIYNKNSKKLICIEQNQLGFWKPNGGYIKEKNYYNISWVNAYKGENEYISVSYLMNTKKTINKNKLSLPENTTATIKKLSTNKYVITTISRSKDITNINDYDMYSILLEQGIL